MSMLIDDLMPEYKLTTSQGNSNDKGVEGKLGKIVVKYEKHGVTNTEKEGSVVKTTPSLFKDLYTILDEEEKIQQLIGFDKEIYFSLHFIGYLGL